MVDRIISQLWLVSVIMLCHTVEVLPLTCPIGLPCECRVLGVTMVKAIELDCRKKNLTHVPDLRPLEGRPIYQIDLSENLIRILPDEAFYGLEFVKLSMYPYPRIDISYNPIAVISKYAFRGIRANEISLVMINSSLKIFPEAALQGLNNLTFLHLMDNELVDVPEFSFHILSKLGAINLSGNKISHLKKNVFLGLDNALEVVYMNDLKLKDFPGNALRRLKKLRRLELDNNQITELHSQLFHGFKTLSSSFSLSLQNNLISTIAMDAFYKARFSLYDLNLNTNNISDVSFMSEPCKLAFRADGHIDVQENPIICDCDAYSVIRTGYYNIHGKCAYPERYSGISIDTSNGQVSKTYQSQASEECGLSNQTSWSIVCTRSINLSSADATQFKLNNVAAFLLICMHMTIAQT